MKITDLPHGVILETQTEPGTGIRKRMVIQLSEDKPSATVTHTLINDGLWAVELAPWAITQFRLGGTAILPLPVGNADTAGLLPNRQLSFWPYTRLNDPRMSLRDDYIFFRAHALTPFKVGYFNPQGWLAYYVDSILFKKTFGVQTNAILPDNNSNAELYCDGRRLPLLLECNVSGEESKFGWSAWDETRWGALLPEISQIAGLPNLELRGLMTMAPFFDDPDPARPYFQRLRRLQEFFTQQLPQAHWDVLSMGMSGDWPWALECGADWLRLGTAIFGARS